MSDTVDLANPTDPKLRALWGDVRAKLGCDPRFEPDGLRLAKKDVEDPPTSFTTKGDEVPGFALIEARNKSFWFGDGGSNSGPPVRVPGLDKPFYIARTLTTVAQYAQFVASSDYVSHFVGEGLKWLDGSYQGPVAYFSPSWTRFQRDRGRHFKLIVDAVSAPSWTIWGDARK